MVWLIDGYETNWFAERYGWRRVAVSQQVWELCVEVPEGWRRRRPRDRSWDLLMLLDRATRAAHDTIHCPLYRAGIAAGVVSDERNEGEGGGWTWPATELPLVSRAGLDEDGSACLFVTLLGESKPR